MLNNLLEKLNSWRTSSSETDSCMIIAIDFRATKLLSIDHKGFKTFLPLHLPDQVRSKRWQPAIATP